MKKAVPAVSAIPTRPPFSYWFPEKMEHPVVHPRIFGPALSTYFTATVVRGGGTLFMTESAFLRTNVHLAGSGWLLFVMMSKLGLDYWNIQNGKKIEFTVHGPLNFNPDYGFPILSTTDERWEKWLADLMKKRVEVLAEWNELNTPVQTADDQVKKK